MGCCLRCGDPLDYNDGIIVCNGCGLTIMPDDSENRECVAPPLEGEAWEIPIMKEVYDVYGHWQVRPLP